jgi:hypothetical protein
MSKFNDMLQSESGFRALLRATDKEIKQAEFSLGLTFSTEYQEYLQTFGVATTDGHEFTGLCVSARLNVVDVTLSERENNPTIPLSWYVVEQANMDGIVIWQSGTGEVYQTIPYASPEKLCESLSKYLVL